jgi:hypothetical protein
MFLSKNGASLSEATSEAARYYASITWRNVEKQNEPVCALVPMTGQVMREIPSAESAGPCGKLSEKQPIFSDT